MEPLPSIDVFESDEAAQKFNNEHDAWGREGWARIERICRDAVRKGAQYPAGWCELPAVSSDVGAE